MSYLRAGRGLSVSQRTYQSNANGIPGGTRASVPFSRTLAGTDTGTPSNDLVGNLLVSPTLAGTLAQTEDLQGALLVQPTMSATLVEDFDLQATLRVLPTLSATLDEVFDVVGTLRVLPTLTGALAEDFDLQAALRILPTLSGALTEGNNLAGGLFVSPILAGSFSETFDVQALLRAAPTLAGLLQVSGGAGPDIVGALFVSCGLYGSLYCGSPKRKPMSSTTVGPGIALNADGQMLLSTTPGTAAGFGTGGYPLDAQDALRVFLVGGGMLVVNNLTVGSSSLRNTDGSAKLVYVKEAQSLYLFLLGTALTDDGFIAVQPTVGAGGTWFHVGEDIFISPHGAPLLLDDAPNVIGAGNAAATYGKRVVLGQNGTTGSTYQFKSLVQMVSGFRLLGHPDVVIQCTLSGAGTFLTAPFAATNGAVLGVSTTITAAAARGSKTIAIALANKAVGAIIILNDALNGNRSQQFVVQSLGGGGLTLTLDRPLARDYTINSTVQEVASTPRRIHIDGQMMLITGVSTRYLEIAFGVDCKVENIRANNSGGGMATDLLFSFDVGGTKNVFDNVECDCGPGSTALACVALESNDESAMYHIQANANGSNNGILMYDCSDCDVQSSTAYGAAGTGIYFTSDNGVLDATTRGCVSCHSIDCTSLASVGNFRVDNGSIDVELVNCSGEAGTIGFQLGDGATTLRGIKLTNCNARFNTSQGINISTNVLGTCFKNLDVTGNGTSAATGSGIVASEYFSLDGLYSASGNNLNLVLAVNGADLAHLNATAAPTPAINGWIQFNGGATKRFSLRDSVLSMTGAANSNAVQTAAVMSISGVRITVAGGAATAVFTQAGGFLRIGRDNDWSGTANAYAANGGGVFSQGTVVLGAAPVAFSFTDLKATDRVTYTLNTLAGAALSSPPIVISTPGTGFTLTRVTAADTSTWNVQIDS